MAGYSTSAPPALIAQRIGGGGQIWDYTSVDASTAVDAANYFTNGKSLGMLAGATMFVTDSDASPITGTIHTVNAASADGSVDLGDALAITTTDSD
jgi:hypothetical protein